MNYRFLVSIFVLLTASCQREQGSDVQASTTKSSGISKQRLVGIWKESAAATKEQYYEDGSLLSKQIVDIDGEDILEISKGTWAISSGKLVLVYDEMKETQWIYSIMRVGDKEMVLQREDYIVVWTRVDDFEMSLKD